MIRYLNRTPSVPFWEDLTNSGGPSIMQWYVPTGKAGGGCISDAGLFMISSKEAMVLLRFDRGQARSADDIDSYVHFRVDLFTISEGIEVFAGERLKYEEHILFGGFSLHSVIFEGIDNVLVY